METTKEKKWITMNTKEERHKIYKEALRYYKNLCNTYETQPALCSLFLRLGVHPNYLPEFLAHMPKEIGLARLWWSNHPSDPNRERVLRDCIEKTKPLKLIKWNTQKLLKMLRKS